MSAFLRDFYRPALARLSSLRTMRSTVLCSGWGTLVAGAGDQPRVGWLPIIGGPRSGELRLATIGRHVGVNNGCEVLGKGRSIEWFFKLNDQ